tara:strand:- start:650 stop:934 length:285 start_codon:yes stop_codon:yes gene_type:complete
MSLVKAYKALERMREATTSNVPFSFEYISCNETNATSEGLKRVERAVLRTGYSRTKGIKSQSLVAFTNLDTGKPGFFYIPLLMKYKGMRLCENQ